MMKYSIFQLSLPSLKLTIFLLFIANEILFQKIEVSKPERDKLDSLTSKNKKDKN